jgi:hypothetical protein
MKKSQWKSITKSVKAIASNFELDMQLRWITQEMISRELDPIDVVMRTIDPNYDQEIRPEVKHNPSRPKNPNHGIFRVIYGTMEFGRQKYKTQTIEAVDGIDAVNNFTSIHDNIFKIKKGIIRIVGVECELIPQAKVREIQDEGERSDITEDWSPIGRLMLLNLINELEDVSEHSEVMTLEQFVEKFSE